jgi:hypothetical protein
VTLSPVRLQFASLQNKIFGKVDGKWLVNMVVQVLGKICSLTQVSQTFNLEAIFLQRYSIDNRWNQFTTKFTNLYLSPVDGKAVSNLVFFYPAVWNQYKMCFFPNTLVKKLVVTQK